MKMILRTCLALLLLIVFKTELKAQDNIDESNLITRLSGLNSLNASEAAKYFTDHNYSLLSQHTIPQATYSMDMYKYKMKDQTSSYLLTIILDKVAGSGYITYNEDEYQQAVKIIKDMGFVSGEAMTPESGKTLYAKGNLRFIIQKKTAANNSVFYMIMLNDLLKVAQLSGLKK
jgi:hypothetical protein